MAEAEQEFGCSSSTFGTPGSPPSSGISDSESAKCVKCERESKPNAGCQETDISRKTRRRNTLEEKRSMNKERKKRKRKTKKKISKSTRDVQLYKQMANDYWDRWKWEQQRRREENMEVTSKASHYTANPSSFHHINPVYITDPGVDGKSAETYLGSGSFSIVKLQVYRGIKVAVKQFRAGSLQEDVLNEAKILNSLCHPNLPFLFGVCISTKPHRLVMQFHGVGDKTATIAGEICRQSKTISTKEWLILCYQLFDAIDYLHRCVSIIHNDIKGDNVLITDTMICSHSLTSKYQVVLIDFGKATTVGSGRSYQLHADEIREHMGRYAYLAPDVLTGETKQTTKSDIYSVGVLLKIVLVRNCLINLTRSQRDKFVSLCEKCKAAQSGLRPSAGECLLIMKEIQSLTANEPNN